MPHHGPAYLTIAHALAQMDSLAESITAYHWAIHLHPERQAAATFRKAIQLDTGHERTAELQQNVRYAREALAKGGAHYRVVVHEYGQDVLPAFCRMELIRPKEGTQCRSL
jgi:hypothetical protein